MLSSVAAVWCLTGCVKGEYEIDPDLPEPGGAQMQSSGGNSAGGTGANDPQGEDSSSASTGGASTEETGGTSGNAADASSGGSSGDTAVVELPEPDRSVSLTDVEVEYGSCGATSGGFSCSMVWTSTSDVPVVFPRAYVGALCTSSTAYAYDDLGGRYTAARVTVANEASTSCQLPRDLIKGVPTEVRYDFEELLPGAREVALLSLAPKIDGVVEPLALRNLPLLGSNEPAPQVPEVLDSVEYSGILIEAAACSESGGTLTCPLSITSIDADREIAVLTRVNTVYCSGVDTTVIDDSGSEYAAARVDVAAESHTGTCPLTRAFVRNVPTPVTFRFHDFSSDADEVARLQVGLWIDGQWDPLEFRELPVVRQ